MSSNRRNRRHSKNKQRSRASKNRQRSRLPAIAAARPSKAAPLANRAAALSKEWTREVQSRIQVRVEAAVVKACPVEAEAAEAVEDSAAVAVVVPAVAVAAAVVVPAVAVAAAEEGDNHVNISINNNETGEGGRNDTSGNTG